MECIRKGKAQKRYEFSWKARIAPTRCGGCVGAGVLHDHPSLH